MNSTSVPEQPHDLAEFGGEGYQSTGFEEPSPD